MPGIIQMIPFLLKTLILGSVLTKTTSPCSSRLASSRATRHDQAALDGCGQVHFSLKHTEKTNFSLELLKKQNF